MKNKKITSEKILKRRENQAYCLLFFIFAGIPTILIIAFRWFLSDNFSMGLTGFLQNVFANIVFILIAIVIIISSIKRVPNKPLKKLILKIVIIVISAIAVILLARPIILDIPYIKHPKETYLNNLEFYDDTNYEYLMFYDVYGKDLEGKYHTFHISEELMEKGKKMLELNDDLSIKISYLPHTSTLMTLEFITGNGEKTYE